MARRGDFKAIWDVLSARRWAGIELSQLVELSGLGGDRALEVIAALLTSAAVMIEDDGDRAIVLPSPGAAQQRSAEADDRWSDRRVPRERGQADPPYPPDWDRRIDDRAVDPAEEAERREGDRLPIQVWTDATPWAERGMPDSACHPAIRSFHNRLTDADGNCRSCHGHTGGVCLMCLPVSGPASNRAAEGIGRKAG